MADYDINGTLFFNVTLQRKGGPRARTPLAEAFLRFLDPPPEMDTQQALMWHRRVISSRSLARSGVVQALAVQPGRVAGRVENPMTHDMHNVKIMTPVAGQATWDAVVAQAGREAKTAAQMASGDLPDSVVPMLLPALSDITSEADGGVLPLDQMPDPLLSTLWLVFAERVDEDPWLWVLFRGQTRDTLLALVHQHAREHAPQASAGESFVLDRFWTMGELPTRDADQPESRVMAQLDGMPCSIRIGRRTLSKVLKRAMQLKTRVSASGASA